MFLNRRGVALLQVLIIVAILGGMVAMILRVVMSRTTAARQTYRTVIKFGQPKIHRHTPQI